MTYVQDRQDMGGWQFAKSSDFSQRIERKRIALAYEMRSHPAAKNGLIPSHRELRQTHDNGRCIITRGRSHLFAFCMKHV